jgi:putative ABC transport system substrate-binding protein
MKDSPRRLAAVLLASLGLAVPSVRAETAVAVLSEAGGAYQAAYGGFVEGFGEAVPTYRLPDHPPLIDAATRVVVAFGSDAAVRRYPEHTLVIVCVAPGMPRAPRRSGRLVFLTMKPPAETLLKKLRDLQPGLSRLAVLWNSEETGSYLRELERAAPALPVRVISMRVGDRADVPDALRAQVGKIDALWLAPDPALVTPETFRTIKQFSWDNKIPFYAPTAGLVAAGAAASVSVSPRELGRQAAKLARRALAGEVLPAVVFPDNAELTVNAESAGKAGLSVSPETLGKNVKAAP